MFSYIRSDVPGFLLPVALLFVSTQFAAPALAQNCSGFTISPNNIYTPATSAALQTALDCVPLGSTIKLGTTTPYVGSFKLPNKTGGGWVTVISGMAPEITSASKLPSANVRVSPADASAGAMASLTAPAGSTAPVLSTA